MLEICLRWVGILPITHMDANTLIVDKTFLHFTLASVFFMWVHSLGSTAGQLN